MGRTTPQAKSSVSFGALGTCAGLLLSAVLLMVAWNWSRAVAGIDGLPQIAAPDGPFRMAPDDPGGQAVPHEGMNVYSLIEASGKPSAGKSTLQSSPQASPAPRAVAALPSRRVASGASEADEAATAISQAAASGIPVPAPRPAPRTP